MMPNLILRPGKEEETENSPIVYNNKNNFWKQQLPAEIPKELQDGAYRVTAVTLQTGFLNTLDNQNGIKK